MGHRSKISSTPADQTIPRHTGRLLVEGVPQTTKSEFKAACARRAKPMRDVIIEFMRAYAQLKD